MRFIGAAEMLGAIGLILPWLLWIRPIITPVAAAGLVIITTGATVFGHPSDLPVCICPIHVWLYFT